MPTFRRDRSGGMRREREEELIIKKKQCYFCKEKIEEIDPQNTDLLHRYLNFNKKIESRMRTGTCAKHQRKLTKAIKKARELALLAFVVK